MDRMLRQMVVRLRVDKSGRCCCDQGGPDGGHQLGLWAGRGGARRQEGEGGHPGAGPQHLGRGRHSGAYEGGLIGGRGHWGQQARVGLKPGPLTGLVAVTRLDKRCGGGGGEGGEHSGPSVETRGRRVTNNGSTGKQGIGAVTQLRSGAGDNLGPDRGGLDRGRGWCGEQAGHQGGAVMADKQGRLRGLGHRGEGGQRGVRLLSQEGGKEWRERLWRWPLVRKKLLLTININVSYFPQHGTSHHSLGVTLHLSCVRRQLAGEGDLFWPRNHRRRHRNGRVRDNVFID